jgi:hypothetical protein
MPQSDYYLCEADVVEIAETFFDQGATIIPDLDYLTPEPLIISTSEKLREILHGSNLSLLFVVSPQWQRSPLQFGSITKGGRQIFYICQKEGGPTLDMFYPRPREVNGDLAIPAGFISYHSRFWNPLTREMERAPGTLIKAYQAVRSHLARGGRNIVRTHRKLTVTKNTLSSGLKLIDLKKHVKEKPRTIDPNEIP